MDNNNWFDLLSPRQPTYWPTDSGKNPDLIDFGVTKNINKEALSSEISYDLSSDHSAIIITYSGQTPISKALTNKIYKEDLLKYKKKNDIENCIDKINNVLLSALNSSSKLVNLKPKPTLINSYIASLVLAKRRTRRHWQSSREPSVKVRLTEAITS